MENSTDSQTAEKIVSVLNSPANVRRRNWRLMKDKIARHAMTVGGISVILAVVLIFFYLLYVVYPLFLPASTEILTQYQVPAATKTGKTLHLAMEEQNEIGVRFTDQGGVVFFRVQDGGVIATHQLPLPEGVTVTSFGTAESVKHVVAYGLSNGTALVVKHEYRTEFTNDAVTNKLIRTIRPQLEYPFGEEALVIDEQGGPLVHIAVQVSDEASTVAAITPDNRLLLSGIITEVSFIDDSITAETTTGTLRLGDIAVTHLLIDKEQRVAYIADATGQVHRLNVSDKESPSIVNAVKVVEGTQQITTLAFLLGDISLMVGDSEGRVTQWFPVRNDNNELVLTRIREFHQQSAPITEIAVEERRKGFISVDETGSIAVNYSAAHRNLLVTQFKSAIQSIAISPRANFLLAQNDQNEIVVSQLHNEHPEVSWSALWGKVWYESYQEPTFTWQSSSASTDFEPKFSLMPLAFGTLKAAFYAMLVAVPIAIFGAIYTAYFMAPGMRTYVKPTIEIMEALPTVILGFLAGLWLAPAVEANLPGVFALLIVAPISILLMAYIWAHFVPREVKYIIPSGWEGALLIPVLLIAGFLSFAVSGTLENLLFAGDMPKWLNDNGIDFDQRNALVVGMAMGLAVIPSIFSITEDAIFSVPKHLTAGSLALGATPWQTMTRVVILTASPGIFSAVMIGLGRAVGETMIVLMATGNTPVMDFSIFQGLRTLSANIAVEMPESEVGSTHYRVLFLAGLVLFLATFFFNTLAEVVRQRLRRKYSSL